MESRATPTQGRISKNRKLVLALILGLVGLYVSALGYSILKWKTYIWLPSYTMNLLRTGQAVPDHRKHIIFFIGDHYEPGMGSRGFENNKIWMEAFKPIAERHRDSYGNRFRYSWFYPYDHKNEAVLKDLSRAAYEGYGEIELHWHHPKADSSSFPGMLDEAIAWFRRYGALVSSRPPHETQFGFIHGNWALDASNPNCGVNEELRILHNKGCYADFTFSTIGTRSQPSKVNSIYYAADDPRPKSYDTGADAGVGIPPSGDLLIFEGPIQAYWRPLGLGLEYGAIESDIPPSLKRVNRWIEANIHVEGRPEWVFVKIYTHGQQSRIVFNGYLETTLSLLESACRKRGITLHYVTAREAVNIVKAAEAGKSGDPESYRNFTYPVPMNTIRKFDAL